MSIDTYITMQHLDLEKLDTEEASKGGWRDLRWLAGWLIMYYHHD